MERDIREKYSWYNGLLRRMYRYNYNRSWKKTNKCLLLYAFLILSLGLFILKFPVFITWRKSLTAVTIMGIICGMNYINKTCINTIIKRIQNKKGDLQNERGQ